MPTKVEGKEIQAVGSKSRGVTSDVYDEGELFRRRDDLQQRMPSIGKGTGFLGGARSPYAASMGPQRLANMDYANYEKKGPNVGGQLRAPIDKNRVVATPTPTSTSTPSPTPIPTTTTSDPVNENDKFLADINEVRIENGMPPFETFEDFQLDLGIFEGMGSIGMADGGIASLEPQYFEGGGFAAMMSGIGGGIASGAQAAAGGIKNLAVGAKNNFMENYNDNKEARKAGAGGGAAGSEKSIEQMSRQELIALIQGQGGGSTGTSSTSDDGLVITPVARAQGGLMAFADGGDVYYPRMNGQIAGPGTERSDDIPAMLSDGEFVVNAKALRGIGKMDGANGDKEDQRMKGARMMYAMQQAGENQMRKG